MTTDRGIRDQISRRGAFLALIDRKPVVSVLSLKALIADLARTGHPAIGRLAKHLGLSTRSLQRDLERRGTAYSDLVDRVRYETAQDLLSRTSRTIAEVGARLGYRDPSSFSRAFARWSGVSPRSYRAARRRQTLPDRAPDRQGARHPD